MSVKVTYFVHGTTTDNESHRSTGWNPGGLSELGVKQSKEPPSLIEGKKFDAVFCSDLKRAVDSAEWNFPDREVVQDARLRECNYDDLNGADSDLVDDADHIEVPFPNGESMLDVEKRVRDFCKFLLNNYGGGHIAVVAHKAPQFAFEVITTGKTWPEVIASDWREVGKWQPGWEYLVKNNMEERER